MKKFIITLLAFAFYVNAMAQDTPSIKTPSIAFKLGLFNFKKTASTDKASETALQGGIQYFKGITEHVDFMMNLDFTSLKYPFYAASKIGIAKSNEMYTALDANVNYKFLTDENKLVPFVTAGLGVASIKNSYYTAYAPIGLGLQIKASQGSFINIISTYRAEVSALTKTHYNHSISYTLPLKLREKKPVMIPDAPVVLDGDNDGVKGSDDDCPNSSGLVKYHGCPVPDADDDGVNDENDKCPTQAGTVKYKGCPIPDADKDGINDEMDKCPDRSGLSRYGGCPIPDTDKDGVNDEEDKCPTIAGVFGNHGCADLQPMINEIASNLKFESGKVMVTKKAYLALDTLAVIMQNNRSITLSITGHTDNTGTFKINEKLSLLRATAVSSYLVKKGVDASRMTQKGFADTKPVGDNKTMKGRSQNRRVDVEVIY
ncbi:MAG: OmpA family protein [Bacteroidetes bacterium]|jgi:OOP family OmpA-OmpF porin|nr:OmpA family protein [Bacteroidota bacterium]